jgi:hypothetical protein
MWDDDDDDDGLYITNVLVDNDVVTKPCPSSGKVHERKKGRNRRMGFEVCQANIYILPV